MDCTGIVYCRAGIAQRWYRDGTRMVQGWYTDYTGVVQGQCSENTGVVHGGCGDGTGIVPGWYRDTMHANTRGLCSHLEDESGEGDSGLPQLCERHVEHMQHRNIKTRRNRRPRRKTKTKEEEPSMEE